MKHSKLTAIIVVHNLLEYTKGCIFRLKHSLDRDKYSYNIIVVDIASNDGTSEWLKRQSGLVVLRYDVLVSTGQAYNEAAKISNSDLILFLHNDTSITPNAIRSMETVLNAYPELAAVGPITNHSFQAYQNAAPELIKFKNYNELCLRTYDMSIRYEGAPMKYSVSLDNFCMLIKKDAFDTIGGFDCVYSAHYFEDMDLSYRLNIAGYYLGVCPHVFVYHEGNATTSQLGYNLGEMILNMKQVFDDKWGFSFLYSYGMRGELIRNIDYSKSSLAVLDVGCGQGGNFTFIKGVYPNAELCGIELNPKTAIISQKFADVRNCNVEDLNVDEWHNKFDYIIAGDIIEHLADPWKFLEKAHTMLKDDGIIIASIPNIANAETIFEILNGRFEYKEYGVLDKTHLRFFTKYEALQIFNQTGYIPEILSSNSIYINNAAIKKLIEELRLLNNIKFDESELNTLQYIIRAKKSKVQ